MLPQRFEERMRSLLGARYAEIATWAEQTLVVRGLRANTLKCSVERLSTLVSMPLEPVPFAAEGFVTTAEFRAGSDPLHHAGAYYMQEPSAMAPVEALDVQPGMRVLDLCAAPGGKSTQIADKLRPQGILVTNEIHPTRARILLENVERMGVTNAVVKSEAKRS